MSTCVLNEDVSIHTKGKSTGMIMARSRTKNRIFLIHDVLIRDPTLMIRAPEICASAQSADS